MHILREKQTLRMNMAKWVEVDKQQYLKLSAKDTPEDKE